MYENILKELKELYQRKNSDYGNSFSILFRKFGLKSTVIRLWDKLLRLETLCEKEAQVKDESVEDTLLDMANYCIMTVTEMRLKKAWDEIDKEMEAIGIDNKRKTAN